MPPKTNFKEDENRYIKEIESEMENQAREIVALYKKKLSQYETNLNWKK